MTAHIHRNLGDDVELRLTRKPGQPLGLVEGCDGPMLVEFHGTDEVTLYTQEPCPDRWAHRAPRPGLIRRFVRWLW